MEIAILVLFFVVIGFLAVRWCWWVLDLAADDLLDLFYRNEEKWWWEKELPQAIGKSGFLTRAALNLLNDEGRLRKKIILINAIRTYSREGRMYYPGAMLLVRIDNGSGPRKKKEKRVWVKRPILKQIHCAPHSSTASLEAVLFFDEPQILLLHSPQFFAFKLVLMVLFI